MGRNLNYSIVFLTMLAAASCSQPKQKTFEDNGDSETSGTVVGSGSTGSRELVTIQVSLLDSTSSGGFSLADATAFDISLDSCISGYTSTADESSTALQVYKFDRGCKAKLTGFEYGGFIYIPTVADPFTTWDANDTAVFDEAGFPGTNAVTVTVVSQLADPVSGTEAIVYKFSELDKGADNSILEVTLGDAHTLTTGSQDPPSFTIDTIAFTGVNAQGGGEFTFTMECTADIGITSTCEGIDFADTTYKLVQDTYASTLLVGDANAMFPAGESAITLPGDRVAPGAGGTVNGGFTTATLTGPDAMATNPNMILILQSADTSYQYFNVDVSTLTQD